MKAKGSYSDLWKAIIRPPRDNYSESRLGPRFSTVGNVRIERSDFELLNDKKLRIKCSHFQPIAKDRICKQLPCIVYLHGNASSRLEAFPYVDMFLINNITLFTFDMSGSGLSEGEYVSLGYYEKDDIKVVVDFLRKSDTVSTIGLWGRSMGAVTALLHVDRDPSIAGMVIDSPFMKLRMLGEELYKKYSPVPKIFMGIAMGLVKRSVKSRAKFDLDDLVPIDHVSKSFIPALFIVAKSDDFIDPHHGKDLYEKYSGEKKIMVVEGDHHSERSMEVLDEVEKFFIRCLRIDEVIPKIKPVHKYIEKKHMMEVLADQGVLDPYICPITRAVMKNPVITKCMHSFEREAILEFITAKGKCPACSAVLTISDIKDDIPLKEEISKYISQIKEIKKKAIPKKEDTLEWAKYVSELSFEEQMQLALEESKPK